MACLDVAVISGQVTNHHINRAVAQPGTQDQFLFPTPAIRSEDLITNISFLRELCQQRHILRWVPIEAKVVDPDPVASGSAKQSKLKRKYPLAVSFYHKCRLPLFSLTAFVPHLLVFVSSLRKSHSELSNISFMICYLKGN